MTRAKFFSRFYECTCFELYSIQLDGDVIVFYCSTPRNCSNRFCVSKRTATIYSKSNLEACVEAVRCL